MKRATLILLLVAIVGVAVLYYLWRRPAAPAPGAPPDLITLLPADASFILYADAAALRASPFVQELLRQLPAAAEDRDYKEFVAATSFDYTRDLDRLAVAVRTKEAGGNALAFADGRFNRQKISAYALKSGRRVTQGDHEAYLITTGNPPRTVSLVFQSDTRISLSEVASHPDSGTGKEFPLGPRIARVAASEIFAVIRVDKIPKNAIPEGWASKEVLETLQGVGWVTFAARPAGNDMNLVLEAECDSPANARKLSWGLEGLRILIRMSISDPESRRKVDPVVAALLDVIARDGKISSADRYVRLSFVLTPQFLAAIKPPPSPPDAAKTRGQASPAKQ